MVYISLTFRVESFKLYFKYIIIEGYSTSLKNELLHTLCHSLHGMAIQGLRLLRQQVCES
jgi:hypothetical protein